MFPVKLWTVPSRTNRFSISSTTKASSKWIALSESRTNIASTNSTVGTIKIQDFETWIVSKEDLILSNFFEAKD